MPLQFTVRHQFFFAVFLLFLISSILGFVQTRRVYFEYITDIQAIRQAKTVRIEITSEDHDPKILNTVEALNQFLTLSIDALNLYERDNTQIYFNQFFSGSAASLNLGDEICDDSPSYIISADLNLDFLQSDFSFAKLTGTFDVLNAHDERPRLRRHNVRLFIEQLELGWNITQIDLLKFEADPNPKPEEINLSLHGFNYYPTNTPWSLFWTNFNANEIFHDFSKIQNLGANAVRIFLSEIEFNQPGSENYENFAVLLEIANQLDLTVVVTLFDLKTGYSLTNLHDDLYTLDNILNVINESGSQVIVDLKNEPDLDFSNDPNTRNWIAAIAAVANEKTDYPITIGWSHAKFADEFLDLVDVVSYHDYEPIAGSKERLNNVTQLAAGKPVIVSEIGQSSANLLLGIPSSDQKQASELASRIEALENAAGVLVWTYQDFTRVDRDAVGSNPWINFNQAHYGVTDPNGNWKPAAAFLSRYWTQRDSGHPVSEVGVNSE